MPLFSIVVPVYQAEHYLDKCISSVLAQTLDDWELILVDDGSRDKSGRICDNYASKDPRIIVIHQENSGVSEARNAGIARATGSFLAFLDSDDAFEPQMLEKLYAAVRDGGADSGACGHFREYPGGAREIEAAAMATGVYDGPEIMDGIVRPLLRDRVEGDRLLNGFVWRFCYDMRIVKENGLRFSGAYLEDEVFLIEYFCLSKRLAVIDDPLYCYLQNPYSVTKKYMPDFLETFMHSLNMKKGLVEKYQIRGIDGWQWHSYWAGLLIAVANEFAPGNRSGFLEKRRNLISICRAPEFADAIQNLNPVGVSGKKSIVIKLIRARQFSLLAALYSIKNLKR
ncbi:MAG TPA: glycosyltransferase [Clostridiales bacterium]|nr:glycosyltransferase [Clostridiales bacterium]